MTARTYEVVTKGRLSPALASAIINGFDLVRVQDGKSYFEGTVSDQARLHEMLVVLGDLNIELLSINVVPFDSRTR